MTDVSASFVPDDFVPPASLDRPEFRLRPLGPEHNESDYGAWTASFDHIHATPGWEADGRPASACDPGSAPSARATRSRR